MAKSKNIFTRVEKKYIVSQRQLDALMPALLQHMHADEYGLSTISSIYFDTPDMRLISASIIAKAYKEKLRLRCYGTPTPDSLSFVELKKKYDGIVYKRRISMPYKDAMEFLTGAAPAPGDQISREIAYALSYYPGIRPAMDIFCERTAYVHDGDENLRLTVDGNLRYRATELDLLNGTHGTPLLPADKYILEIKTAFSMPLWLVHLLDENKVYPGKFSKYGTAFNMELQKKLAAGSAE